MVTFRFYVVSVVAFFLALAVGVVLGSALDGRISASLQDRLQRVEANLDSTVDLIDQKNAQISSLNKYAEASIPFAVDGRLDDTSTLIVAQSGVNVDRVADIVAAVRLAGSATPGVLWLDKSWDPRADDFLVRVDKSLDGGLASGGGAGVEQQLWSAVFSALVGHDEGADGSTVTTSTAPTTEPEATAAPETTTTAAPLPVAQWWDRTPLKELADNSVIRLQTIGQISPEAAGSALNVVIVMGRESELSNSDAEVAELARVAAGRGLPVVIAEVNPAGDKPAAKDKTLAKLFDNGGLPDVSTVQSADEPAGRVAVVLALQQAATGQYGHYGRGGMAKSLLPPAPATDGGS